MSRVSTADAATAQRVQAICLHGHFYQPERDDPWTGRVPAEASAAPYHDWNERIDAECYRPNAAARRLGADGRIATISSNFERMSWNAGPSLLRWLERHDPWTHERLVAADRAGAARFGGHGPALAQPWVHAILPLSDPADRRTLVRWGIVDFERRFGRRPEGMWLPETAVDTPTLEELASQQIAFTILAPWQVDAAAEPDGSWRDVDASTIDTTRPYRCDLPSGRSMALWCYDGALSAGIAFGGWLEDGHRLAGRVRDAVRRAGRREPAAGLVHVATDGESYGHHHRWGEMALAVALCDLDRDPASRLTVYGEQLEREPAAWRGRLAEPTAWSCAHGVERWRSDCGCHTGGPAGWSQAWRAPLREALDWLRDALCEEYETLLGDSVDDPWAVRDDYGRLLALPAGLAQQERAAAEASFVADHGGRPAGAARLVGALEMQRHLLTAFESSAWFYADLAGLEPVMALRHAARAIDWCIELGGRDLEPDLVVRLATARSNDPDRGDGSGVWASLVRTPVRVDDPPTELPSSGMVEAVAMLVDPERRAAAAAVIEASVRRESEALGATDGEGDGVSRDRAAVRLLGLERLASGLGFAELPGRWWLQNAVVDCRDRWGEAIWTGSFAVLAERAGVAPTAS